MENTDSSTVKRHARGPIGAGIRWLLCALLLIFKPGGALAGAPLELFVSIPPQKFIVERVGGRHVSVSVIAEPGRSPATYEPTPRQMSRLSGATLYFTVGVAFEEVWMARIAAANPKMKIIALHEGIPLREVDGTGGAAPQQGRKDPHIWTNPALVKRMAARIRDALVSQDPLHAADYRNNLRRLCADLDALDRYIRERLRPFKGRSFMVFHPSWGYFADAYGLRQIPIETGGKEPGARALQQVIAVGRREGVKVVFVQQQFSSRSAETVARAMGARIAKADPLAEEYLGNMRRFADMLAAALEKR